MSRIAAEASLTENLPDGWASTFLEASRLRKLAGADVGVLGETVDEYSQAGTTRTITENDVITTVADRLLTRDITINDDVIKPDGASVGNSGVTGEYWVGVRADAFFEESPIVPSYSPARLDELPHVDWYAPPRYVRRGTDTKQEAAEGAVKDDDGIELGHMTNYLLEITKQQQSKIDELEQRLTRLESNSSA